MLLCYGAALGYPFVYDDRVLSGPGHLQLPRDELKHAFVLMPLAEIAPDLAVGALGTVAQLHSLVSTDGVERIGEAYDFVLSGVA